MVYTNYQFYIDQFIASADIMSPTDDPALRLERSQYTAFIEPETASPPTEFTRQ
jgi:hypothetical protein